MKLTPAELEQILYDAAPCSCPHCQRVRRMWEHVKAVERELAQTKEALKLMDHAFLGEVLG